MAVEPKGAGSDGPLYGSVYLYELAMGGLYGRHYFARQRVLADLIPDGASLVELCAGPGLLYRRHLRERGIRYTGIDLSQKFVAAIRRTGAAALAWDLRDDRPLPAADYVLMQASLYQFLPDPNPVLERMLSAAGRSVIVAEPIRNLQDSRSRVVRALAGFLTRTGDASHPQRFTEASLDAVVAQYAERVEDEFLVPGGREKVVVFDAR